MRITLTQLPPTCRIRDLIEGLAGPQPQSRVHQQRGTATDPFTLGSQLQSLRINPTAAVSEHVFSNTTRRAQTFRPPPTGSTASPWPVRPSSVTCGLRTTLRLDLASQSEVIRAI